MDAGGHSEVAWDATPPYPQRNTQLASLVLGLETLACFITLIVVFTLGRFLFFVVYF